MALRIPLSYRRFLPSRIVYGLADTPHSLLRPPSHRAASGGGAPCLTAGDIRAERGGTRGDVDRESSDAGVTNTLNSLTNKKLIGVTTR